MDPITPANQALREWAEVFMQRSMHEFMRFTRQAGLSHAQLSTLMRLYYHGNCPVSDIGSHLGVTNAAASQLIDRLVGMGLLERSEHPSDRRVREVGLTQRGRELVSAAIQTRHRWIEELAGMFSPAELEGIVSALALLTQAARRSEPQKSKLEQA